MDYHVVLGSDGLVFGLLFATVEDARSIRFETMEGTLTSAPHVAMNVCCRNSSMAKPLGVAFQFYTFSAIPQQVTTSVATTELESSKRYVHARVTLDNPAVIDRRFISFAESAMLNVLHTEAWRENKVVIDGTRTTITADASAFNHNDSTTATNGTFLLSIGISESPFLKSHEVTDECAIAAQVQKAADAAELSSRVDEDIRTRVGEMVRESAAKGIAMLLTNLPLYVNQAFIGNEGEWDDHDQGARDTRPPRRHAVVTDEELEEQCCAIMPTFARATLAETRVSETSIPVAVTSVIHFTKVRVSVNLSFDDGAVAAPVSHPAPYERMKQALIDEAVSNTERATKEAACLDARWSIDRAWNQVGARFGRLVDEYVEYKCMRAVMSEAAALGVLPPPSLIKECSPLDLQGVSDSEAPSVRDTIHAEIVRALRANALLAPFVDGSTADDVFRSVIVR